MWIATRSSERLPEVSLHDLQVAWLPVMKQAARACSTTRSSARNCRCASTWACILRRLQGAAALSSSSDLFDPPPGAAGLVVSFLAMLELAREKLVEMTQSEVFAPIYVKLPKLEP